MGLPEPAKFLGKLRYHYTNEYIVQKIVAAVNKLLLLY